MGRAQHHNRSFRAGRLRRERLPKRARGQQVAEVTNTRLLAGDAGTSTAAVRVLPSGPTMADESGDGGGSSMATLLRDKLVGSDLEPLHVELTE